MRQDEIAVATKRVIARKGLASTTLRDIAREAGFTTGVITHHFPDKSSVIIECFTRISAQWIDNVEAGMAAATTPRKKLAALLDFCIPTDAAERESWCVWAEMWTHAGRTPSLAQTIVAVDARWEVIVADVLAEAKAANLVSADIDPTLEAASFVRLVDGLGLRAWVSGDWSRARQQLVRYLGVLGLRNRLAKSLVPTSDS